jgi:hypothetical protein
MAGHELGINTSILVARRAQQSRVAHFTVVRTAEGRRTERGLGQISAPKDTPGTYFLQLCSAS